MASVFWDARGIIFIDYLQKGKKINGEYYANLLQRLSDGIKIKRPHLAKVVKDLPTVKRWSLRLIAIFRNSTILTINEHRWEKCIELKENNVEK